MAAPDLNDPSALDRAPFVVGAPPEEEFWDRYNRRLEFPLAAVAAVLFHVVVLVGLVYGLLALMAGAETPNPKLEMVTVVGMDDAGQGSAGSGGKPNQDPDRDVSQEKNVPEVLPSPQEIADAKVDIQKILLNDPTAKIPITASNATAYSQLEESLRKKLLGTGAPQGKGNQPGTGSDNSAGSGPGETGADSTRQRGFRWSLNFMNRDGREYLEQLKAMGAELLIPIPGSSESIIVTDIGSFSGRKATGADISRLAARLKFGDTRGNMLHDLARELKLDFTPKTFFAFFPEGLEQKLAGLETRYRNRRPEDIEETKFRVTVRGGKYEFEVTEQQVKR